MENNCKIGDKVYYLDKYCLLGGFIYDLVELTVKDIVTDQDTTNLVLKEPSLILEEPFDEDTILPLSVLGDTLFTNKVEALARLQELDNEPN